MANEHQLDEFYTLETWRLAQLVLAENDVFADARDQLVGRYGHEVMDPLFIDFVTASTARKFISAQIGAWKTGSKTLTTSYIKLSA